MIAVAAEWGQTLDPLEVEKALKDAWQVKLLAVDHAETSTGVVQPLALLADLAHGHNALFVVDATTYARGVDFGVDEWGIDLCYRATEKCLGSPPGLSPITLSPRAVEALRQHQAPVPSFYLDLLLLERYWLTDRVYHHTASMPLVYALREALIAVQEEGLKPGCIALLLGEYGIEIGGAFGPLAGKVWHIGLLGESSQARHVLTLMHAL